MGANKVGTITISLVNEPAEKFCQLCHAERDRRAMRRGIGFASLQEQVSPSQTETRRYCLVCLGVLLEGLEQFLDTDNDGLESVTVCSPPPSDPLLSTEGQDTEDTPLHVVFRKGRDPFYEDKVRLADVELLFDRGIPSGESELRQATLVVDRFGRASLYLKMAGVELQSSMKMSSMLFNANVDSTSQWDEVVMAALSGLAQPVVWSSLLAMGFGSFRPVDLDKDTREDARGE